MLFLLFVDCFSGSSRVLGNRAGGNSMNEIIVVVVVSNQLSFIIFIENAFIKKNLMKLFDNEYFGISVDV